MTFNMTFSAFLFLSLLGLERVEAYCSVGCRNWCFNVFIEASGGCAFTDFTVGTLAAKTCQGSSYGQLMIQTCQEMAECVTGWFLRAVFVILLLANNE